jgi:thiosulfate dehydrogenase [quinone] large subunit
MTTSYAGRSPSELVEETRQSPRERYWARIVFATLRIVMGFTFLWAFLDKLFGLGYATPSERSWINGGSPTKGFLANSADGPFAGFYKDIAGAGWADWLFMIGLAGIGIALLLGVGMRVAAVSGAVLYLMMWSVALPPQTNRSWTSTSSERWRCWHWRSCTPATPSAWAGGGSGSRSSRRTAG